MKLNNTLTTKRNAGMTLLELTVVILVLLSLISILFVGARAWKKGSDRSANIMNIRNCQQAMRGEQNMKGLNPTDPFDQTDLEAYIKFPSDIGTEVTYTPGTAITAESANPATADTHLWLRPSASGLPGGEYGHEDVTEITGW
jgi:type II secretory pathway pseudopilin PulG